MMTGAASGAPARAAAATAVDAVLHHGRDLDRALAGACARLEPRPASQARALAYGALRWHCRHAPIIAALLDRPPRRRDRVLLALLSTGIFELVDGRQPDYAAVSATVAAARLLGHGRAAGLVNASLRRFLRERDGLLAAALEDPAARYAHPAWLIEQVRDDWPADWEAILAAAQAPPPLWLRVNRLRSDPATAAERLAAAGIEAVAVPGFPDGLRIDAARPVEALPGFAAGELSVQDAAAQLAAELLDAAPGMRVLDACAAPGGKACHLLERAGGSLECVAVDRSAARLGRVAENLARLGLTASLMAADAARPGDWWDGRPFDRILVDAPCTGTGVIRRHPDIRFLRRPDDIAASAALQDRLLRALWPLLAPGGRLLYATCSVLAAENRCVVQAFLAGQADARALDALDPRVTAYRDATGATLLPGGGADTDGFYYGLMMRESAR